MTEKILRQFQSGNFDSSIQTLLQTGYLRAVEDCGCSGGCCDDCSDELTATRVLKISDKGEKWLQKQN
jgi:hypothetical protein